MGSRLSSGAVVAALLASTVAYAQQPKSGQPASQRPAPTPITPPPAAAPQTAADFAKQGNDLYTAGDYSGAVAPLQKAVDLEPKNFEYRFMLAQALRQSGNCGEAVPQYKQALASAPAERSEDVKGAMASCPNATPAAPPPMPPSPPTPTETVVVHGGIRTSDALMLIGAGAGLATGFCLALAAHSDQEDADAAASYEDHSRIAARADRLYIGAIVGAGVGIALGAIAAVRIKSSKESTHISLSPRKSGGMLVLERAW